jgi:hypothetical protein
MTGVAIFASIVIISAQHNLPRKEKNTLNIIELSTFQPRSYTFNRSATHPYVLRKDNASYACKK